MRGVNLQYHYKMDSLISLMTSLTWMKGDDELSKTVRNHHFTHHVDVKYYSALFGPSFRINDYASFYVAGGPARIKVRGKVPEVNRKYDGRKSSFAYGAGFIFNVNENFTINAGYEGTRMNFINDYTINTFNVGIGYNF
ncbi:Ail/Lom family outer membrane beta-barrel protein [Mixta intestinalis]